MVQWKLERRMISDLRSRRRTEKKAEKVGLKRRPGGRNESFWRGKGERVGKVF